MDQKFRQELEKERESHTCKRIKIHKRLVKAFRAPSRLTVRNDSAEEEDNRITEKNNLKNIEIQEIIIKNVCIIDSDWLNHKIKFLLTSYHLYFRFLMTNSKILEMQYNRKRSNRNI